MVVCVLTGQSPPSRQFAGLSRKSSTAREGDAAHMTVELDGVGQSHDGDVVGIACTAAVVVRMLMTQQGGMPPNGRLKKY